jgi:hypothetical protein
MATSDLNRRATRRVSVRWLLLWYFLVFLAIGPVARSLAPLLFTDGGQGGGRPSLLALNGSRLLALCALLVVGAVVWPNHRGSGWFSQHMSAVLPRPRQAEARQAVRRGVPSADPARAAAEREIAERVVATRWGTLGVAALAAGSVAVAVVGSLTTAGSWCFALAPVPLAGVAAASAVGVRRARRYLAAAGQQRDGRSGDGSDSGE